MKGLRISILLGILFLCTDHHSAATVFNPPDSTDVTLNLIRKENPDELYKYEIGKQISIQMDREVEIEGLLTAVKDDSIRIYSQWIGIDQIRSIVPPEALLAKKNKSSLLVFLGGLGTIAIIGFTLIGILSIFIIIWIVISIATFLLTLGNSTGPELDFPVFFLRNGFRILLALIIPAVIVPLILAGRDKVKLGKKWSLSTRRNG